MRFHIRVIWTQWFIGVWWWPVPKDFTIGAHIGPIAFHWTRRYGPA